MRATGYVYIEHTYNIYVYIQCEMRMLSRGRGLGQDVSFTSPKTDVYRLTCSSKQ